MVLSFIEVKHSQKGGLTMYIDHSDWCKSSVTTKRRNFKTNQSKKMTEDDTEDSLDLETTCNELNLKSVVWRFVVACCALVLLGDGEN